VEEFKMTKKALNRIEKEILRVIIRENRPMMINEISRLTGISWSTVKKYIPILIKKGVVDEVKEK
jgi:predicted transcriptional regulator